MDTCLTHPHVTLVRYCPACRGAAGGRKVSPRKTRAARKNAKKPRARRG